MKKILKKSQPQPCTKSPHPSPPPKPNKKNTLFRVLVGEVYKNILITISKLEVFYGGHDMEKRSSLKGKGILPAASIAAIKIFFFGLLGISILISVRANLLKFIWHLTMSGASTRA